LTVVLQEHRAADAAAVQLWVRVGARHEGAEEGGFSHFIEHLLFKGTPSRGPGAIDETISGLGGEMNAATSHDFTYFHVVLPARHLGTALEVLADAARNALFDSVELDRERQVVLEEIRRSEDSPPGSLWRILSRAHFPDHPYGRPILGSPESIQTSPRVRIVDYFRRHYTPANAAVVVAAPLPAERLLERVAQAFGEWTGAGPAGAGGDAGPSPVGPLPGVIRTGETRALQQTYASLAWRGPLVPDPDVYSADLLAAILGQGRVSRLYQALREERRLVSSISGSFYPQHDAGTFVVTARTTPEQREAAEAAILEEVDRLCHSLVEPDELERARTGVEAGHAFGRETAEGAAYAYGAAETVWTLDFELGYVEAARRVTREQIRDTARRFLGSDRYTAATLGPNRAVGPSGAPEPEGAEAPGVDVA
jgi:zinc protease